MKKVLIVLCLIVLSIQYAAADVINPLENWRCIDKTGRKIVCPLGYNKDSEYNQAEQPENFDELKKRFNLLQPFSEGLAAACLNRKCGYVDKEGNWAIEPKFYAPMCYEENSDGSYWYDYRCRTGSSRFSEGLAAVEYEKNKTGYINKKGELVIKFLHGYAGAFSEGLAAAMKEGSYKYGYIDKTGEWVLPPQFLKAGEFKNGAARVSIILSNKSVCEIKRPKIVNEAPGRILTESFLDENGLLKFKNLLNDDIVSFNVYKCENPPYRPYFHEGLAAASAERGGKCGYINTYGDWVIKPKYDTAFPFINGKAMVSPCGNPLKTLNKKEAAAVFSAVLLILVIIAGFSMRKLKK